MVTFGYHSFYIDNAPSWRNDSTALAQFGDTLFPRIVFPIEPLHGMLLCRLPLIIYLFPLSRFPFRCHGTALFLSDCISFSPYKRFPTFPTFSGDN